MANYNHNADALNAAKHRLETQLGITETVPAQTTRLVPDWAVPWHPPEHSPHPINQGPGSWQPVNAHMSPRAEAYQSQITGRPIDQSYIVDNVRFDDFRNGTLIEVKSYFTNFIENGEFKDFWTKGPDALIDQAIRQVRVAHGTPLEWVFAEPETAAVVRRTFETIPDLTGRITYTVIPPRQ